jgi:hypothetical protein
MHPLTLVQWLILHVYLTAYIWPIEIDAFTTYGDHSIATIFVVTTLTPDALEYSAAMALAGVASIAVVDYHKRSRKKGAWIHALEVHFEN